MRGLGDYRRQSPHMNLATASLPRGRVMNKQRKYWYEITYTECVLCGASDTYRERRYTPKPKDPYKRIHFEQYACCDHF